MEREELKPGVIPANFSDEDARTSKFIVIGVLGVAGLLLVLFTFGAVMGR